MQQAPWRKRQHIMPDMFTFELEGHDDTIVLWGGRGHALLVSCTLGKDLGHGFLRDVWTRRSTRCATTCAQCDAVFVPGARFDADMDPALRRQTFPAFPQVEWEGAETSEFQLAARLASEFAAACAPTSKDKAALDHQIALFQADWPPIELGQMTVLVGMA